MIKLSSFSVFIKGHRTIFAVFFLVVGILELFFGKKLFAPTMFFAGMVLTIFILTAYISNLM